MRATGFQRLACRDEAMGKIADATFTGVSSRKYSFTAYTLDTSFKNVGAVYIFTERRVGSDGNGRHTLLYIGETSELADRLDNHEKWPCVQRHGCNCICVHADEDEDSRLEKVTDLRHGNKTPCNDQ